MTGLRHALDAEARRLGFGRVRVATAVPPPDMAAYDAFLAEDRHGTMDWLARGRDARAHPERLLPGVRSVAVLAMDYGQPAPPDPGGLTGRVACYAWGRDYHNLIGKRLRKLQRALEAAYPGLRSYAGVDSRPLWERAWAARAGLGFAGRNGCAIAPGDTSYFFLAVLLLSEELEPDAPVGDHCGRCRRCVDACPTGALSGDGGMDARRCISYLTIEHAGSIAEELRPLLGRWLFGCDDCQEACPHVRVGHRAVEADFAPRHAWLDLPALLDASDDALLRRFEGSPIRRAAPEKLRRNACVVLGNLGDGSARPALERARARGGVVAEHAAWALDRLA